MYARSADLVHIKKVQGKKRSLTVYYDCVNGRVFLVVSKPLCPLYSYTVREQTKYHESQPLCSKGSSRISTSNLATTTVGSKTSFKHAGQQPPSDSDNSIKAYVIKAFSNQSKVIVTNSTSDKQKTLQQCMQTSTRSSNTDTSSKLLPTVSSILLLERKKQIFQKKKRKW